VAYADGVVLDFSRPGKPTDNAFVEVFNSRDRRSPPIESVGPTVGVRRRMTK
jgi:transposase InsO family protein